MEFGPDDLVMFGIYYVPSLIIVIVTFVAILAAIVFVERFRPQFARLAPLGVCLLPVPFVIWVFYFVSTSDLTTTLILLDSESSGTAEKTYSNTFKAQVNTVDAAVRLAVNRHQAPNVRFYASCLIADMLVTNDDATVVKVTKEVEDAPVIETEFFGGNRLTKSFYIPGHVQPSLTVQEIVEQRLQELRETTP
jgi:hypothetical protein